MRLLYLTEVAFILFDLRVRVGINCNSLEVRLTVDSGEIVRLVDKFDVLAQ